MKLHYGIGREDEGRDAVMSDESRGCYPTYIVDSMIHELEYFSWRWVSGVFDSWRTITWRQITRSAVSMVDTVAQDLDSIYYEDSYCTKPPSKEEGALCSTST